MTHSRRILAALLLVAAVGASRCGNNPVDGGNHNGGGQAEPYSVFDVFLRPLSVERPVRTGSLPAPQIALHYLSAFSRGGTQRATYDWTLPPALGTLVPKSPTLSIHDATVALQLPAPSTLPLGFYDITATGQNGGESGAFTRRFAVVENRWMKSARVLWVEPEPDDPTQSPTFFGDDILFVEAPSGTTVNLNFLHSFAPLDGPVDAPLEQVLQVDSDNPPGNNFLRAPKLTPDVAPASSGRAEILFGSRMDTRFGERCPGGTTCPAPINLWVVANPQAGGITFKPRELTFDSTFVKFGSTLWHNFNFSQPRWDPTTSGSDQRIAFLSDIAGGTDLWTGVLRDRDGNASSDTLVNYQRLTTLGNIAGFDWHPDGTRLVIAAGGLAWVDAATGSVTPITLPQTDLTRILSPTVFWRPGEHTLVAFQAQTENRVNLYVLDVNDNTLTRLLPYGAPVSHNLFPRFHRTKKWLTYISDYTVAAWARTTGDANTPDVLSLLVPELDGMQRTRYPSPWVLKLED